MNKISNKLKERVEGLLILYPMVFIAVAMIFGIVLGCNVSSSVAYPLLCSLVFVAVLCDFVFRISSLLLYSVVVIGGYVLAVNSLYSVNQDLNFDEKRLFVAEVSSSVDTVSTSSKFRNKLSVELIAMRDSTLRYEVLGGRLLCYLDTALQVEVGDTISFRGKARKVDGDYGNYLAINGYIGKIYGYDARVIARGEDSFIRKVERLRHSATNSIYCIDTTQSQSTALMNAMVVGDKSDINKQSTDDYRNVGASHLLAISGLHIGIVVALLNFLLGGIKIIGRRGRVVYSVIIILMLWAYAIFSGMSLSVERAVIMFTLYQIALMIHRSGISLNILATSAVIVLLISPLSIYDIGFQLSYMAMVGIALFYYPLRSLYRPYNTIVYTFWCALCLSLAAQLTVMPLIVYHFGNLPWFGIVISLFVWVTIPIVIISTMLYLITSLTFVGVIGVWVTTFQGAIFAEVSSWRWIVIRDIRLPFYGLMLVYLVIFSFAFWFSRYAARRSRRTIISLKQR